MTLRGLFLLHYSMLTILGGAQLRICPIQDKRLLGMSKMFFPGIQANVNTTVNGNGLDAIVG